jgi:proteic killer suppression protein
MNIRFKNNKIKLQCENPKEAQKAYGKNMGNKLTQRVYELIAAENLEVVKNIASMNLHTLIGKRSGEYAIDLVQPFRLIISPIFDGEEVLELSLIENIKIEEVVDYHGKQKR